MPLIELTRVSKDYRMGETMVAALKDVKLKIEAGEFVAIWGPSGSGKTTLLNLLGAIDEPTSGQVRLQGKDLTRLTDNERSHLRGDSIGFIFQHFNLIPVLSALENVMLPLQIRGKKFTYAREKAMAWLSEVGLEKVAGHRPDKMSGGQQQRVAIARALVTEPAWVVADEPTANLDSATAMSIIEIMRALNQRKKTTFIFSTHDNRLLQSVGRKVGLRDGRIQPGEEEQRCING